MIFYDFANSSRQYRCSIDKNRSIAAITIKGAGQQNMHQITKKPAFFLDLLVHFVFLVFLCLHITNQMKKCTYYIFENIWARIQGGRG